MSSCCSAVHWCPRSWSSLGLGGCSAFHLLAHRRVLKSATKASSQLSSIHQQPAAAQCSSQLQSCSNHQPAPPHMMVVSQLLLLAAGCDGRTTISIIIAPAPSATSHTSHSHSCRLQEEGARLPLTTHIMSHCTSSCILIAHCQHSPQRSSTLLLLL